MSTDDTYTAYDFINTQVDVKNMKFGWKVELKDCLSGCNIVLRYTMLNFDWSSFGFLGGEGWNLFLSSKSYLAMRNRLEEGSKKFRRTYFEAESIRALKALIEDNELKANVDKMVQSLIERKSEQIKERNELSSRL